MDFDETRREANAQLLPLSCVFQSYPLAKGANDMEDDKIMLFGPLV